jgi:hypothetical protein
LGSVRLRMILWVRPAPGDGWDPPVSLELALHGRSQRRWCPDWDASVPTGTRAPEDGREGGLAENGAGALPPATSAPAWGAPAARLYLLPGWRRGMTDGRCASRPEPRALARFVDRMSQPLLGDCCRTLGLPLFRDMTRRLLQPTARMTAFRALGTASVSPSVAISRRRVCLDGFGNRPLGCAQRSSASRARERSRAMFFWCASSVPPPISSSLASRQSRSTTKSPT